MHIYVYRIFLFRSTCILLALKTSKCALETYMVAIMILQFRQSVCVK